MSDENQDLTQGAGQDELTPPADTTPSDAQPSGEGAEGQEGGAALGEASISEEEKFAQEYTGKPETGYNFEELELPEGFQGFDEDLTGKLGDCAGKYNMSQKGANEFMSLGVEIAEKTKAAVTASFTNSLKEAKDADFEALKSDKELGGANLEQVTAVANQAFSKYFTPQEQQRLDQLGVTCMPSLVRAFKDLGQKMQDDSIHSGQAQGGGLSREEILYPNLANKS